MSLERSWKRLNWLDQVILAYVKYHIQNSTLQWVLSIVGLLVFSFLMTTKT